MPEDLEHPDDLSLTEVNVANLGILVGALELSLELVSSRWSLIATA